MGMMKLMGTMQLRTAEGLGLQGATSVSRVGGGSKCLLFFTGGSNLFQSSIYEEFVEALESRNIDVCKFRFSTWISRRMWVNLPPANYDC